MSLLQLFILASGLGALLHLLIRQPFLVIALTTVALTLYELVTILSAQYRGGGASMWPIAAFFVAVGSAAGAALGVFIVSTIRKIKH